MQVNINVLGEYSGIIKDRQNLKEALIPIPILKKDAEYSFETSVSIIFIFVEPLLFSSTVHILLYNDILFYVISIILILYKFSKRNIKAP
jgi:hypothetical protein